MTNSSETRGASSGPGIALVHWTAHHLTRRLIRALRDAHQRMARGAYQPARWLARTVAGALALIPGSHLATANSSLMSGS